MSSFVVYGIFKTSSGGLNVIRRKTYFLVPLSVKRYRCVSVIQCLFELVPLELAKPPLRPTKMVHDTRSSQYFAFRVPISIDVLLVPVDGGHYVLDEDAGLES